MERSRFTPLKQSAVTLFCLYHMGAVLAFNLPHTGLGDLRAPFAWYAHLAWPNQQWSMFTTIPHYARLQPQLVARQANGQERSYGPMLPGLGAYSGDLRAVYLVLHTLWPGQDQGGLAQGYLRKACAAIQQHTGERPQAVTLKVEALELTPLAQVRASQRIGRARSFSSKTVPCR
jgi:hypothetical protein